MLHLPFIYIYYNTHSIPVPYQTPQQLLNPGPSVSHEPINFLALRLDIHILILT